MNCQVKTTRPSCFKGLRDLWRKKEDMPYIIPLFMAFYLLLSYLFWLFWVYWKKILRQIINSGYSVFIFLNIFLIEENWTPDILRQSDGQLMRDVLTVDSYCSACISKTVLISSMWSSISNYIARRLKILFISFN